MGLFDSMLTNMSAGDQARTDAFIRDKIIRPTIEEFFMPENLERLAAVIANQIRLQEGE